MKPERTLHIGTLTNVIPPSQHTTTKPSPRHTSRQLSYRTSTRLSPQALREIAQQDAVTHRVTVWTTYAYLNCLLLAMRLLPTARELGLNPARHIRSGEELNLNGLHLTIFTTATKLDCPVEAVEFMDSVINDDY